MVQLHKPFSNIGVRHKMLQSAKLYGQYLTFNTAFDFIGSALRFVILVIGL